MPLRTCPCAPRNSQRRGWGRGAGVPSTFVLLGHRNRTKVLSEPLKIGAPSQDAIQSPAFNHSSTTQPIEDKRPGFTEVVNSLRTLRDAPEASPLTWPRHLWPRLGEGESRETEQGVIGKEREVTERPGASTQGVR